MRRFEQRTEPELASLYEPQRFWNRPVVILDCESTGVRVERDRIIELALWRIDPEGRQERFASLLNPETWLPPHIAALTGIRPAELWRAPRFQDLWPKLHPLLEGAVLVGHNVRFDVRLLQAELRRLGVAWKPGPTLCTLRLARRLLPGLPSRSLDALAKYLGLEPRLRHRAMPDVELTKQILDFLAHQAAQQEGLRSLAELLSWQYASKYLRTQVPSLRALEPVLRQVPKTPGIYRFYGSDGQLLYVGKAACLRKRVQSHFTALDSKPVHLQGLIKRVSAIEWQEARCELEALLMEAWEIARYRPPFNRQGARPARGFFVRLAPPGERFAVHWTFDVDPEDSGHYYGPFRRRDWAARVVDLVREHISGLPEEKRWAVARRFLSQASNGILEAVRVRMLRAAEEEDFEEAIAWRELWSELRRVLGWMPEGPASLESGNTLGCEHAGRSVRLWLVRGGSWMGVRDFPASISPSILAEALARWWAEAVVEWPPGVKRAPRWWRIRERRLLLRWIALHGTRDRVFALGPEPDWLEAARWALSDLPPILPPKQSPL
ncbi:MAG: exonuclease domain-containing protein [Bacteroidota bacterium]|nr:exonuclease domain-containing protein [Rhodothermia bacterium]MDW8285149.1 exonuclease domain-containing protein [Bacteroidota bacterium]